jgi:uncharacterized protein
MQIVAITDLHARHAAVAGLGILGLGGSLPCPGKTPWEFSESELDSLLCQGGRTLATGSPFVLVSHQPPLDTANDLIASGLHVGSRKVLEFIQKNQPLICFTGHIHEGTGTDAIGITRIVNPGPFRGGHYTLANVDLPGRAVDVRINST